MTSRQSDAVLQRAALLRNSGALDREAETLIHHLEEFPDDGKSWEALGLLLFSRQQFESAEGAIEKASALVPISVRGQLALGKCYDKSGHRQSAAAIYRHLASLDEMDSELFEPLAAGLGYCGEFELALNVCRKAARVMPDNAAPLIGMVHYMHRLERPIDVILPTMIRAHELEPDSAEYRIMLAWLFHKAGRREQAVRLLTAFPLTEFTCVSCLSRMERILRSAGEERLTIDCRARIAELTRQNRHGNERPA